MALTDVVNKSTRIEQLKELLEVLAKEIDNQPGARDLAQLSRQYRETLKEIDEIEGAGTDGDEITELLSSRESARKSGSIV